MLTAERTALNFLQRLTGIATLTRQFVDAAAGRVTVLDTRKTTPLLRVLEKYAVRAGGAVNHRKGLDDGILIKDNHIRLAGGVEQAVTRMRKANREMPTEVEAQTLEQVDEALAGWRRHRVARQPLDPRHRAKPSTVAAAARRPKSLAASRLRGCPSLRRQAPISCPWVRSTHSAPAVDLSFEIEPA